MAYLDTAIEYLKGVGPARAQLLQSELGIYTFADMLEYLPYRHIDRSNTVQINQIDIEEPYVVLRGTISDLHTIGSGSKERLSARLQDSSGAVELVWFKGLKWIRESLKSNTEYVVMGRPSVFNDHINIAHPDIETASSFDSSGKKYYPVYSITEKMRTRGLTSKVLAKLIEHLLVSSATMIPETLPPPVLKEYHLPSRQLALTVAHYPKNANDITVALHRLKFEELFFLQLDYQYAKSVRITKRNGLVFGTVGNRFNTFYRERLSFELTSAQKRVIREIRDDMRSGCQMNRLLQGDVGSGKTLVALLCMLIAADNGYQSCLMVPTEILATQHFETITKMLGNMDVSVALLTGSVKQSEKRHIREQLKNGSINILIGTHAVIEKNVEFDRLGFVVIDEQHRFGVEQRSKLWTKSSITPHVLVMTATPIPRTLAMTLYGDLDCSVIDELPPGRRPVKTIHCTDSQRLRVFAFLKNEISKGRQVYVVYPLIEESESMDLKDLMDGYESVVREFPLPQYQISIVHGRMSSEAKDYEMMRFKRGETNIMVSTTVIEVGVDVPNATVMVIENAERFGLSQLHQLRGRVGRGGEQSYCILMTGNKLSTNGKERINTMVSTTDGFRIAEADLKLRGPGDMQGLQQSGLLQLKVADIVNDNALVEATRNCVRQLLEKDPSLQSIDNACLLMYITKNRNKLSWGKIS